MDIMLFLGAMQHCGIVLREVNNNFESNIKVPPEHSFWKQTVQLWKTGSKNTVPSWAPAGLQEQEELLLWTVKQHLELWPHNHPSSGVVSIILVALQIYLHFSSIFCIYDTTSSRNHLLMYIITITSSRRLHSLFFSPNKENNKRICIFD